MASDLRSAYPWTKGPLIASAPMLRIAGAPLAVAVSQAQGLGFIGGGNDISTLEHEISRARDLLSTSSLDTSHVLPLGIGFLLWGAPLQDALAILRKPENVPAAVWLFAPRSPSELKNWADGVRAATGNKTRIWIQVTNVSQALSAVEHAQPDVLVVQGQDAGGHGGAQGAGLTALLPEVIDAVTELCGSPQSLLKPFFVATGGISDGRGAASSLTLGAHGAVLGTRYLASTEATIAPGYQDAVVRAVDGGVSTIRSSVYDRLRGTPEWPPGYGGRGVLNASFRDHEAGLSFEQNKTLYEEALKSGDKGWEGEKARLTTYAGTGVGLVKHVLGAHEITTTVREESIKTLKDTAALAAIF